MIFGIGNAPATWSPPGQFDQFTVVRPLGRGGMGQVFLGRDDALDRHVALKFISAAQPSLSARERFLLEARAIARLSHPAVVSVYRIGEVEGRPYLAYEFIEGESLDKLIKPLSWESALRILVGLARGLEAAHAVGIVHRDVKPANVMLSVRGEVKLLDFGLAKLDDGAAARGTDKTSESGPPPAFARPTTSSTASTAAPLGMSFTRPGTIVGTPAFMAPELWIGERATARSDVFALGLVAYELLVGALPHSGVDITAMGQAIVTKDMPSIRAGHPDIPGSFSAIVDRCVRSDPAERFESAKDVRQALEDLEKVFLPASHAVTTVQLEPDRVAVAASLGRLHGRMTPLVSSLYRRLFARDSSLRPLFPVDLVAQEQKLAHTLQLVIEGLGDPERLAPVLEDLGRRHVRYGVDATHFAPLERALLESLAEHDADAWKPELERAWRRAFAFIESSMRRGMMAESGTVVSAGPRSRATAPRRPVPVTAYAGSRDRGSNIAYQVTGAGPVEVVVLLDGPAKVEAVWDEPVATLLRALAQIARVAICAPDATGRTLDERTDAICAVMDAVGFRRALFVGLGDGAALASMFASLEPDRVRGLAAFDGASLALPTHLPHAQPRPTLLLPRGVADDVIASIDAIASFFATLPTAASDILPLSVIVVASAAAGAIERAPRALGACALAEGGVALGFAEAGALAWAFDRGGRAVRAAAAMRTRVVEDGLSLQLAVDVAWCERHPPADAAIAGAIALAKRATAGEVLVSEAAIALSS